MAFLRCLVLLVEPSTSTSASPLPPERGESLCYTESYCLFSRLLDLASLAFNDCGVYVSLHIRRPIEESKRILEERLVWSSLGLWFYVRAALLLVMVTVLLILQAKAQQQRDRIQEEKTYRSRMITEKVPPPLPTPTLYSL